MFKWGRSTAKEDYDQAVAYSKKGNYKKAIKRFRKAAEEGLAVAQYELGSAYANG